VCLTSVSMDAIPGGVLRRKVSPTSRRQAPRRLSLIHTITGGASRVASGARCLYAVAITGKTDEPSLMPSIRVGLPRRQSVFYRITPPRY
jgi:hypothetical protein